ncbi:PKD domain-containing protein [Chitinophaga sp. 180180018-2]|nr:PKD domain-containing protein [Chitinophaga sp. 212800010-3]
MFTAKTASPFSDMKKLLYLTSGLLLLYCQLTGQTLLPYILNGAATQRTCNCYVLTPDQLNTSGTVWNKNKINLDQSFNYVFDVNLGSKHKDGADGIGFILQTQGTNLGASGGGLGFKGISPSLGVLIDTHQNREYNDPAYDHLAIQINGDLDHNSPNNVAGPVTALKDNDIITDGQWHLLRISWDANRKHMEVYMDKALRLSLDKDIVKDIFNGNPEVFWGFAGSTGALSNLQQFCAALRPAFGFNDGQVFCDGVPVQFQDNSSSFGTITRWWWDLGDGTTTSVPQPPAHTYPGAGHYTVRLVIEDNSGCRSDTLNAPFTVGSIPVADFGPNPFCLGTHTQMSDKSTVQVGTLQQWKWDWDDGSSSNQQNPAPPFKTTGTRKVKLSVITQEGCSNATGKNILVANTPQVSATSTDVCLGNTTDFNASNLTPGTPIAGWYWNLGNNSTAEGQQVSYKYADTGYYRAQLYAVSTEGCQSAIAAAPARVTAVYARPGSDTIVATGQPLQLRAQWTDPRISYQWSPATGLNDPYIADPVAVLQKDQQYRLTLTSPEGCTDQASVNVKVYKGPEFYVPNAFTPNGDGRNDLFRVIAAGVPTLDFFCIWDRWGQEVYRSNTLPGGWDGRWQGQPAPTGTYVWMVQGVDYTGRRFSRKGTVTLIR